MAKTKTGKKKSKKKHAAGGAVLAGPGAAAGSTAEDVTDRTDTQLAALVKNNVLDGFKVEFFLGAGRILCRVT